MIRARVFASFALFFVAAGCGPPDIPDFDSGGIEGASCPPGSEPDGSCSDPDCGVPCAPTIACNPDVTVCPLGTTCDTLEGEDWCIPTEFCTHASDCKTEGSYCSRESAKGICAVVPATGGSCKTTQDCSWPYTCFDGTCGLPCSEEQQQCPASMTCSENRCVAAK